MVLEIPEQSIHSTGHLVRKVQRSITLVYRYEFDEASPEPWLDLLFDEIQEALLDPVRDEPEFARIVERARPAFEEQLAVLRRAREDGSLPGYFLEPLADLETQLDL